MKKPRILVVGSFVMDLTAEMPRFPKAGETLLGTSFSTASGGKGANQAVQAAKLGADVTMVGKVGADSFGNEMIASCKEAGVHTEHILRTYESSSGIGHIQVERTQDHVQNRILVVPGANMMITLEDIEFLKEKISDFDMVILQLEIPLKINRLVTAYAIDAGVPVMLNPAPYTPLEKSDFAGITFASPNETEAESMIGIPVHTKEAAREALQRMVELGIRNPIVTMGSVGAVCQINGEMHFEKSLENLPVKDPTAAGDSFVGAFCVAVSAGCSIRSAMVFAKHAAGITVCGNGAQPSLPNFEQVFASLYKIGDMNQELLELKEVLKA